ncbi:RNA polymerase sigma factor [Arcticibacter eurypsychrophilus]|uniref:RNA polymerase sigma factor n=1 Tax=Arcticibacter eurypsychrophilus TaxID=1434752 RepID=UPI00084DA204|nr:RNA polymerase sigma-70 factor [Arcticibacter eurypsychrophilus]
MQAYNQLTDFDLAVLLKNGERNVFREIYDRYWDKLYVIASKRLNDELEAEEVVQDIFCNLWRRRDYFVLTTGFSNYFATAVKFEVINRLAKRVRQQVYQKEAARSYSELDYTTLQTLDLNELKTRLQHTIDTLPDKCRLVFTLKHEKGYTQRQIAQELCISEKTVEVHLSRARKTLRSSFGNLFNWIILFI